MALTRSWQATINDANLEKLAANYLERHPFYKKIAQKKGWIGTGETITTPAGPRNSWVVSFLGSATSSVKVGAYQTDAAIAMATPVRGLVSSYVDMTGSLKFNEQDLDQHEKKGSDKSLMMDVKSQIELSMYQFKNFIEDGILNTSVVSTVSSTTGYGSGILVLNNVEKIEVGQGYQIAATGATTKGKEVFCIAVNKNTGQATFSASYNSTALDLTDYIGTAALTTICVNGTVSTSTGAVTAGFDSLQSILLSATNGGGSTYLGQTKTSYAFLQAYNADGSNMTSSNFLQELFKLDATEIGLKTKHPAGIKPKDYMLSPLNYAIALVNLERYKGQFYKNNDAKANPYGWESIEVGSATTGGAIRLNKFDSLGNSVIPAINFDTFALVTNNGIEFSKDKNNPNNDYYWHTTRNTTGKTYILDYKMSGQFVCGNPESNAIIKGVSMSL